MPNRSSVPVEHNEFDEAGRGRTSACYDRVVDVMEEPGQGVFLGVSDLFHTRDEDHFHSAPQHRVR
jgi:hypothetical protein